MLKLDDRILRTTGITLIFIFMIGSCTSDDQTKRKIMDDPHLQTELQALSTVRIFFAHQSVGENIIAGIRDLYSQHQDIPLTITSLSDSIKLPAVFFAEKKIGFNADYESKCNGFADVIDHTLDGHVDIAVLKFCYVDISYNTDIRRMLAFYKRTIDSLKTRYPGTTFVYVTDPLMKLKPWWKNTANWLLRRDDHSIEDNVRRNEFNQLLLQLFNDEFIFDLAAAESTHPDGSKETFDYNGGTFSALVPAYTDDGGHLNELGRIVVARAMVKMLANVMSSKPDHH